jgi:hypothetical protein
MKWFAREYIKKKTFFYQTNCINKTNRQASMTKWKDMEESYCGIFKVQLNISLETLRKIMKNLSQHNLYAGQDTTPSSRNGVCFVADSGVHTVHMETLFIQRV